MIWRCPQCRGRLNETATALLCSACGSRYELFGDIPDLRVPGASWIDREADAALARRLLAESGERNAEELVRSVFAGRGWPAELITRRTRGVMEAPARLRGEIDGWLRPVLGNGDRFLDLGCGPGMLLVAAAEQGIHGIGVDVSLVWLVVARQWILEQGGAPVLAAALGESLPFETGSLSAVAALDVIEHVGDAGRVLAEIDRVLEPDGRAALSTPNRYSLAAEPHLSVWGVGWLPRSWHHRYVRWRTGMSYESTRLIGVWEAKRLLRRHTAFRFEVVPGVVPAAEIDRFPLPRRWLARTYNHLAGRPWARWLLLHLGPFFRVLASKAVATVSEPATRPRP